MADYNPLTFEASSQPVTITRPNDIKIAVRVLASDGETVLLDTRDEPVSFASLIENASPAFLWELVYTYGVPLLLEQRGVDPYA